MSTPVTLEYRFNRIEKHLIGIWRFREHGKAKKWCATYCYNGDYFDTGQQRTKEKTLDIVFRTLKRMGA